MQRLSLGWVVAGALLAAGCGGLSRTEERVVTGGALGAAAGATVGAVTGGSPVTGAILGGALGAGGGYLFDQSRDTPRGRHRGGRDRDDDDDDDD